VFGQTIDYVILQPLTHRRNVATEQELDARADHALLSIEHAVARLQKLVDRMEGRLPIDDSLHYLDIGCGTGELAIALARSGCKSVTGIDLIPRNVSMATRNAERFGVSHATTFVAEDAHRWKAPRRYDVIVSHEALEHIHDPRTFLHRIRQLISPKGIAVLAFGPLFHSPLGDHMDGFFRVPIPWRGALFSEGAILRLRRECYRPTDPAECYRDIKGGLNQMRYSEFLRFVAGTGWEFGFLSVNPQLRRLPAFHRLSNALLRVPVLRDYIASSVYVILRPVQVFGPEFEKRAPDHQLT
jgi:SAM-dependent methyltransferase